MCKLLFVSMCFCQCSFFMITDKLLPFDLLSNFRFIMYELIVFIGIFFSFSFNKLF